MSNVVELHPEMSDTERDLIAALNDAEYLDEMSTVLVFEYEHFAEDLEFILEEPIERYNDEYAEEGV